MVNAVKSGIRGYYISRSISYMMVGLAVILFGSGIVMLTPFHIIGSLVIFCGASLVVVYLYTFVKILKSNEGYESIDV